jgi:predicted anti-sigma-YlaC factor YlaD
MALRWRRWVLPAAVLGAIGQVGLVNSFSHIHTPIVYVLLRTVYALAFGSVIGAALVAVLLWNRRRSPVPALRTAERARPSPVEMPPVR